METYKTFIQRETLKDNLKINKKKLGYLFGKKKYLKLKNTIVLLKEWKENKERG